ncbi:MAG: sulfatase-like hydrolase/transferase, partial [Muribaculaceae bacterium]|nr:sulfatase-like hydrolase/transferase [Muribaculaceae bacterium]
MISPALRLFAGICGKITTLALAVGLIVRIILAAITPADLGFNFGHTVGMILFGAINDLCMVAILLVFILLYLLSVSDRKFRKPLGYVLLAIPTALFIYVTCFNTPFHEYGSVVPLIAQIIFGFWAASFAFRLFVPKARKPWRLTWFWIIASVYVLAIYFNAVSEYFFWDEFNVRYNFIAVDYLIYTNEVIGNIMESYSIVPLFTAVIIVTGLTSWLMFRSDAARFDLLLSSRWKLAATGMWIVAAALGLWGVTSLTRLQQTENTYYNELQANGIYKFIDAFRKNHLDYSQFYLTTPDNEAEAAIHALYGSTGRNLRHVAADSTALFAPGSRPNIVLVTLESMSASFMERYGDPTHITPNLDSLALASLTFDNLIATG